ncbi:RHO1 GDP-GTP exchange protein 2 [Tieghemiomyces parasiticus]|uniref:RHO1 GDP-GTP exchange protein 2 n=1 Tax=Tieghemiomyces parasiticus TaxID=78921 RepID=A0A9W7ZNK2_9FUNG|nr:RHO1 GDP-GTP exchange protein 2 [Tieghemiomyces parasiticus]
MQSNYPYVSERTPPAGGYAGFDHVAGDYYPDGGPPFQPSTASDTSLVRTGTRGRPLPVPPSDMPSYLHPTYPAYPAGPPPQLASAPNLDQVSGSYASYGRGTEALPQRSPVHSAPRPLPTPPGPATMSLSMTEPSLESEDPAALDTYRFSDPALHPGTHYENPYQQQPQRQHHMSAASRLPHIDTHHLRDRIPRPPPKPQPHHYRPGSPPREILTRNHTTAAAYEASRPLPSRRPSDLSPPESAPAVISPVGHSSGQSYHPRVHKRYGHLTHANRQFYLNHQLQRISLELDGGPTSPSDATTSFRSDSTDSAYAPYPVDEISTPAPHTATASTASTYRSNSSRTVQPSSSSMTNLPMSRRATDSSVPLSPPPHSHRVSDGGRPLADGPDATRLRSATVTAVSRRIPPVYPAMLSRVADAFRLLVPLRTHFKDDIKYHKCFSGAEAVDAISAIIDTTDRDLALHLGRTLGAQDFFHDVIYDHRLRDSAEELYTFHDAVRTPYAAPKSGPPFLPSGFFTNLAECYSATCTVDRLCYSITCPRRLEQAANARNAANQDLSRTLTLTLTTATPLEVGKEERLWAKAVPPQIMDSVTKQEHKRQELIFELIYTEKDYVRDLELMQEIYIKPLYHRDIIPADKRRRLLLVIFSNVADLLAINAAFRTALCQRQAEAYVVDAVGDVVHRYATQFKPYVLYGAHQVLAKHLLDLERNRNPRFSKFLDDMERHPEARKLNVTSFLGLPTRRLGRYPLLLEGIRKATPEDHPDHVAIPKAVTAIHSFLAEIDLEAGKAQNRVNLSKLKDQLQFKPADINDLNLMHDGRLIVQQGTLKKRSSVETTELTCFLLDHMFFMAKKKKNRDESIEYKIFKRPIPLELLTVTTPDEGAESAAAAAAGGAASMLTSGVAGLAKPLGLAGAAFSSTTHLPNSPQGRIGPGPAAAAAAQEALASAKGGFPMVVTHLGRRGGTHTLYAATATERREWMDNMLKYRDLKAKQNPKFELSPLTSLTFPVYNRINTSVTFDHGRRVAIGTDQGVYVGLNNDLESFEKLPLAQEKVFQIDILEEYDIFFVLSDKDRNLWAYPLEALNPTMAVNVRPRKMHAHVTFFKAGMCMDELRVCSVRSSNITSTIKMDVPIAPNHVRRSKSFGRLLPRGAQDIMRLYKKYYIPSQTSSLHLFRSLIIVGCLKGFEIVNPLTSETQELLDPNDESLNFVRKRDNIRPIAIFKVQNGDFLLCYDELAFYVNKNGQRARPHWIIHWEGEPTSFTFCYPYILAFNPNFIEVRHVETGNLEQVIITGNSTSLCTDPASIHIVATPSLTEPQRIYKLLPIVKVQARHAR